MQYSAEIETKQHRKKMAELKTKKNEKNVADFLNNLENEQRKKDCFSLLQLMGEVTGEPPAMWGDSMIGFGTYHYKYKTGREGDWFPVGFSPRKQYLTIYILSGFKEFDDILENMGKYKTSSSCLYVKSLEDIDQDKLKKLIKKSVAQIKNNRVSF